MNLKRVHTGKAALCLTILMTAAMLLAVPAMAAPEASFGGQYRINSYYLQDKDGTGDTQAARVRIRQNIDLKFSEAFDTHLQFNIGHIREGVFNHNLNHNGNASFGIRHAVMNYHFSEALNLTAGIVPLSDKFGDTLFSADWDFNPITFALLGDTGGFDYRIAYFKITEGGEAQKTVSPARTKLVDDIDAYIIDLGTGTGAFDVGVMGLLITAPDHLSTATGASTFASSNTNYWIGGRLATDLDVAKFALDVVYASVDRGTVTGGLTNTTADDRQGVQLRASLDGEAGGVSWGLLALWTQGDKDAGGNGTGFITPQTFVGSQGYWGKTGVLNVQGPTDTGMDQNMLRSDNDGYGLFTIQGGLGTSFNQNWSGYAAVSYFRASKDRSATQTKNIGTDFYAQIKYAFDDSPLALEVGGDIAALGAGHYNSALSGTAQSRTAYAIFSRLQAEF